MTGVREYGPEVPSDCLGHRGSHRGERREDQNSNSAGPEDLSDMYLGLAYRVQAVQRTAT